MRVVTLAVVLTTVYFNIADGRAAEARAVDCTGVADGTFVYDTCASFVVCYGGKGIAQNCDRGSYFDETEESCLPDTTGSCPENAVECTVNGEFTENPSNCSTFYVCYEGELVEQSCGSGSYFVAANSSCAPDVDNSCWSLECTENGAFSANPTNCSMFYVCYDGKLVEQSCGSGSYFDTSNLYCVPDLDNSCWMRECNEDGAFSANPANCSTFYVCYDWELVEQSCGSGSYFDAVNLSCAPDVDNSCWSLECTENGAFSANPTNCSMFYVCYDGKLVEQSCGTGSYFDSVNLYCVPDVDNVCWTVETTSPPPCQCPGGYAEGDFIENPDTCYLYSICSGGQLVEQNCGAGNYFNADSKTCEKDKNNVCWPQETTTTEAPASCSCPGGYADGEFVANPDTCYLYSICSGGQLVEQNCGAGNYFNADSKTCEKDKNNVCWPQENTTTEAPASCSCPGGYADGEFVANPDTCYLYSICSGGQLVEHNCGAGNYFNADSKTCEKDKNNVCWPQETTTTEAPASCSCPGGYADGEFVANPDTCYLYSICSGGQLVEQNCGAGNYFNADSKTCEKDKNNVCWPQETTTTEAPASCSCPGGYADGEFVANPDTCYLYSICSGGQLVEHNCGAGNYFNADTKTCEKDEHTVCWAEETATTVSPASSLCPGGLADGDLIESEDRCDAFYICFDGELIAESCGNGNYFDRTHKTCVRDNDGSCWQSTTTTMSTSSEIQSTGSTISSFENRYSCSDGHDDGDVFPYPGNCSMFYVCMDRTLIEVSCDYGNYFDNGLKSCVLDTFGVCWRTSTSSPKITHSVATESTVAQVSPIDVAIPCPDGYEDGDFASYSINCSMFYICLDGKLIKESCGFGNYFDTTSGNCILDTLGVCWQSTVDAPTSNAQSSTDAVGDLNACPEGYEDGDFAAYSSNCSMFYICDNGQLIEKACGYGNYFDRVSRSCLLDTFGICWQPSQLQSTTEEATPSTQTSISTADARHPCPQGYDNGEFTAYPKNCFMFNFCFDGELIEGSCGYGNYFDNSSKSCILDTLGVCWPLQRPMARSATFSAKKSTGKKPVSVSTRAAHRPCRGGELDGDFIPYPNNCSMFYVCYNGKSFEESCGYGNYFDNSSKSCILDVLGVCWQPANSPTINPSTKTKRLSSTTPPTTEQSILSGTNSTSTNTPHSCAGGFEYGEFVPYPNNCSMFFICYDGKLAEDTCGYGNYFDKITKSCVLDTLGVCWQAPIVPTIAGTPSTTPSTTRRRVSSTSAAATSSSPRKTTTASTTLALSTTTASTAVPLSTTTAPTTITLSTTKASTSTTFDENPYSCLNGHNDGELFSYPNNCSMFYFCYKGMLMVESCGYNNYFDRPAKRCVFDTTRVCWHTLTSSTANSEPSTAAPSTAAPSTTASSTAAQSSLIATQFIVTQPTKVFSESGSNACSGGYADGEFIPHPSRCYQFLVCYRGEAIEMSCGLDKYFDVATTSCVPDKMGICWPKPTSASTMPTASSVGTSTTGATVGCRGGYLDGELVPVPGMCYLFFICYHNELTTLSCGEGNYFDKSSKGCAPDTQRECWKETVIETPNTTATAVELCSNGMVEGQIASHQESCHAYQICDHGELLKRSCGLFNYFNPSSRECERDYEAKCWPTQTTALTETKKECPNGLKDGQFIASPLSCLLYQICSNGELVEGNCGTFNYFNPLTNHCERDLSGACWPIQQTAVTATKKECPNDLKDGQFIASPSSCFLFQICSNGELVEGNCGTFNYFNPLTNHCERDLSGACWPPQPTALIATKKECPHGLKEGQFIASPSSCFLYEICSNGELVEGNCGTFNYFNPLTNHCERDLSGVCWPAKPTALTEMKKECPNGLKDGQFIASPLSCLLYQICSNGELVEGNCGTFNYFNPLTNHCERDLSGACWPIQQTAVTATKKECPNDLKDGQFIASPSSCFLFQICSNGELVEGNCGTFNYFNPLTNHCERDLSGACWPIQPTTVTTTKKECPNGLKDGQFIASPSSCFLFQICSNGELVEGNCGTFNYFNPLTNHCERDLSGACWPIQPTAVSATKKECPNGLKDGQFVASPSSCFLYQICSNGELVEGNCGTFNYFNPLTNHCERDLSGACWPIQPTTVTTTKKECPNGLKDGQFIASPSSCFLFQICSNGELVEGNCGTFNYFNPLTNHCERDLSGACWPIQPTAVSATKKECPNGLKDGQFVASPSSCFLYQICSNGELVEGNCGTFNYFNPLTNHCERDLSGACWPIQPTTVTTTKKECPNGLKDGQFIASPSSCFLFQICSNGELVEGNCGTFNYFNPLTNHCERDLSGACWPIQPTAVSATKKECPNGLKDGQFVASPSSCFLYQICSNGELVEGNCGTFNYFNPLTNHCERDLSRACWPIQQTAVTATKKECPNDLKDGQFIASPSSCFLFQICSNGELVEGNCGTFNYFNPLTNHCERDLSGACWPIQPTAVSATKKECPNGLKDGQFTASPSSCLLYEICSNGELVEGNCGTFNYFNPLTNHCERDLSGACWPIQPTAVSATKKECPNGLKDGQFVASPSSCFLYQICSNGELVEGNCGTFNYFNPLTNHCERDLSGACWPIQPTTVTTTKKECPNGLKDGQFIASPSSCFLFQICSNGELVEGNCGTFNYFNPLTNHCERDLSGACWPAKPTALTETKKECPNGLRDGQFTASPSSCLLYEICSNGELVEGNCGTFNYFNPLTNHCERDLSGACWPIQPTTVTTTKKECPNGLKDGQFIASPSSCFLFQICSNGELVEGNCGTFNYFNPLTHHCERDLSGACWPIQPTAVSATKKECPNGLKDGQFVASPSSCFLYQICSNGELVEGNCGTFNYFNPLTNHCERDLNGACWPIQPTTVTTTKKECPNGLKDGQFIASPSSCFLFQICSNGELVEGNCGTFNYFNPLTNHCERDLSGACWPIQPTAVSATKKECPNGLKDGQFVASPSSCFLYQICSNGELVEGNCGTFNYFNPLTNHCERDLSGACWPAKPTALTETKKECPNGLRDGQFTASPSSCLLYEICSNGELVEGNCGTFNYFNPLTNHCERDLSGACWPIQPTAVSATKKECPNGLKDGQFTASPSSCLLYEICSNGELVEGNCGTFNYFNPLTNHCERDLSGACWPIQPTAVSATKKECPNGLKDGQFVASASSCFLYQICSNGELVEGNCGTFNYFNPLTNHCERDLSGACWPIQPTTVTTTKKECPNGLKDGQFIASPSSCFLFQICSNGELVEGNCGTFNYFNPLTTHCERDLSGACWPIQPTAVSATKKECPNGLKDGQFTASPSSCLLYEICSNGELVEGNCGTFNYFNPLTNHCERDLSGACWPIQPTAVSATQKECQNGLKDGQFVASSSSCFLYEICSNGELVEGNCGASNYFNTNTNLCERDTNGVCWPIQPTTTANPNPTESAPNICSNGQLNGQLNGHGSSCSAYFICTAGELVEGNCGMGNYFNTNTNICEPDINGNCWPLTPETSTNAAVCPYGLLEGQFTSHSASCSSYYICSGGELVEGNCGFGNYFDTNENICQRDTTGLCWPIKSTPPPRPTPPAKPTSKDCPRGTLNGQLLANPSSCHLYYICNNGELVDSDCGSGNIFNTTTLICKPDLFDICWPSQSKSCPVGVLNGQFIANPSSCQQYQICSNGQLLNGDCGSGKFFNRTSQICEPDVLGICNPSNAIPPNSKPCPIGVLNGQFIANPSSCQQYQICSNGQLLNGDCGSGKFFNRTSQICEPDVLGICNPSNAIPPNSKPCPIGVLNGQFIANPSSCQQYQICNNGQLLNGDCGSGKFFNRTSQICEPDVLGICNPSNAIPPNSKPCPIGVLNGQFIANPSSCQQYQICNNGQLLNGDCGSGKFFNRTSQICEPDVLGICNPSNAIPPNSKPCPIGVLNGQFIANPSSCQQYQICNNGQLLNGDCGSGKFFNRTSQICEPDVLGICNPSNAIPPNSKPCPIGVLNGQFIANPSSCQQYQICNNGQLLNGDCGSGKFFNRTSQICEPDVLGICNPSNAIPPNSKPCPIGVLNGQFIANPSSCQQYQICNNGQLLNGDCGSGKFFNRTSQICEPDVLGICNPSNAIPPNSKPCPIGVLNGQFIANPSSCQQYQICNNGQLLNGDCGSGKFFNRTSQICEPDVLGICNPSNAIPPNSKPCPIGVLNGQFIANPSSCQQYQICNNGQLLNGDCGSGKFFNRTSQICEPDVLGICNPSNAIPPNSKPCPIGVLNGQFIANPSSCQQYQICNNGQLLNGDCGSGKFFNRTSQICEPDVLGICNPSNAVPPNSKPCPIGVLNGQFIANPSSCQQYQICNNGQLLNGDCGSGKFFNRTSQICEPDVLGICNPSNAVPPNSKQCPIGVLNGQFIANPSSCQQYQICNNGQLLNGDCGSGKFFNRTSQICEPDLLGICNPSNAVPPNSNPCPIGVLNGQFIANPSSCQQYQICNNGQLLNGDCGSGKFFNRTSQICEHDVLGVCGSSSATSCSNGLQSGQFIANPSSCHKYQICYNGKLLDGDCGAGKLFNKNTLLCEPDVFGICNPININACPAGVVNGQFVPIPGECDKFWICNGGSLIEQSCGVGYYYDVDNKYCTRDVDGSCWTAQTSSDTCIGVPDGTFLPNDAACNKFFMCYNNTKISQECGVGNVFSSATLSCVRDTLGTCWKKVTNVCAKQPIGSFVPNPSNCQEFYVCYSNRAVLQQCGNGNYFNSSLAVCEPDLNGVCVNVCQGLRGNVSLPHSNCNQFYICSDGLTTGVGTCPTGTNFDALAHVCLSTAVCEANLCSSSANGVVYPVQNDASSFYSCYNHIALKMTCPEGTAFDSLLSICIPDTGRCVGRKNGFTVASPNNPNAYYVCKSNMAIFEQCPSYAIFDEKKGVCVQAQRKRFVRNICSGEPDGSLLPGDACNTYHLCLDGEVVDQNCGAYSAFSVKLGHCVFNLSCFDRNEICAKASDIETFSDARRQTAFIKCRKGVAKSEKCQKHLIYSHDIGYCVPREMTMSEEELVELCENNTDNTMAPALDCRKFYMCRNKVAILQQCAVDQYFDVKTGSCKPDVDRKCWQRSETLRRSFFLKSVCLEDQMRVHPDDCTRYKICAFGMWLQKSCPRRQVFDANSQSCIPGDADKVCPHARSAVVLECSHEMPLRPSDEACTDYYRCADNQWELKRCPVGEFFNPLAGTCSRDVSACARVHVTLPAKDSRCVSNETVASDTNCGLYYICYEGEWWYRHCAEGTYFNKSQDSCTPNDGTCRLTSEKGSCKNGTAKPSDFNPCSAYHLCVDGSWTVQYCPAGHHFKESRKACMQDDDEGTCRSGVRIPSSTCVDGERRHQTSNCAAFDLCSFGKWYSVPCPQGSYFDISLRRCIANRGDCSADGALRRDCIEGTSRPSQYNCTEFYYCTKGKWYVESCLKGFQYNATIDKCIQTNATCPARVQTNWPQEKCADAEAVSSEAHESNCTMYYLCVHGLAVEADCALGQFYDEKSKRCRLNNGSCRQQSAPSDVVCKEKANGSRVQNPSNCTTYYTCTDAVAVLSYCPVGEYFNAAAGTCQTDTGMCNKVQLCDSSTGDPVPHEVFCNIYYSCVRGLALPVACDVGQLFDPFTKKCTADVHSRCVDGILVGDAVCLNGEDSQPKEDTEDCSVYIMCSQETAQRLQCPKGQFFNTSALACAPNNGSCAKAGVSTETMSCTGKHGYLMPDLEHCNGFYVCINGALQHDRCVDGEYFDTSTRRCTPMASNQTCAPAAGLLSELCATSEDDTNFADPSDCRKFFQCNNAEVQSKKCRTGESFDALLGFCRQNDGTCLLENGQRVGACAGKHGKLALDAENCRGYFTCINGQKIPEECEIGELFDKATKTCTKDLNSTCKRPGNELLDQTQLSCSGLTELVFYPNVIDGCQTFYQCVKGTPRIHKCPDDLLFNGVTGTCDWKDYVKCIDMTDHQHSDKLCANAKNGTRYGSTLDNCDSYFVCTNGKLNSFRCDNGLKFNTNLDKCDNAANVNCTMAPQI